MPARQPQRPKKVVNTLKAHNFSAQRALPVGRPSTATPDLKRLIIDRLMTGRTLHSVCLDDGMPICGTVYKWSWRDPEFAKELAKARQIGWEMILEDCISIADDADDKADSRRVRVESRLKLAAVLHPTRFGSQSIDITTRGQALNRQADDINLVTAAARLLHMLDLARRNPATLEQHAQAKPTIIDGETIDDEPTADDEPTDS